jgi:ABC-type branched-subunit amino acid transport system ATPase component
MEAAPRHARGNDCSGTAGGDGCDRRDRGEGRVMSIEVAQVGVRFGGVTALQDVDLTLTRGEVLAVIGPNGSGKSTLFNAITGFVNIASGRVAVDGRDLAGMAAENRIASGISRTFQTPRINPAASVEEAVLCGFHPHARTGFWQGLLRPPAMARTEAELRQRRSRVLEQLDLLGFARQQMGELPMGIVRLVDIARAMAAEPNYLLLDEPAAGLSKTEQNVLIQQVRRLAGQGVGVLLVEHNFGLVRRLADRVMVLDRGKVLLRGTADEVSRRPEFITAYLGTNKQ